MTNASPSPPSLRWIAYGQNAEDIVLLRAFEGQREGFYVDVGAGHPTEGSLTRNLICHLGWRGLDIEPLPEMADALQREHPNSTVVRAAVGQKSGEQTMYRLLDNWGMSTLDAAVAARHAAEGWTVVEEQTAVRRLDAMLEEHGVRKIDLLKVDAEGFEEEVFRSLDLRVWRPRVIVSEATAPASQTRTHNTWEPDVLRAGYRLCLFDGLNRFYVHESEQGLASRLDRPANVFDRYILLRWWRLLTKETQVELLSDNGLEGEELC